MHDLPASPLENRAIQRGRLDVLAAVLVTTITTAGVTPAVTLILLGQPIDLELLPTTIEQLRKWITATGDTGLAFIGALSTVAVAITVTLAGALAQLEKLVDRASREFSSAASTPARTAVSRSALDAAWVETADGLVRTRSSLQTTILALLVILICATSFTTLTAIALAGAGNPVPRIAAVLLTALLYAECVRGFMAYATLARLQIRATPAEIAGRLNALNGDCTRRWGALLLWIAALVLTATVVLITVPDRARFGFLLVIAVWTAIAEVNFRAFRSALLEARLARSVSIVVAVFVPCSGFAVSYLTGMVSISDTAHLSDARVVFLAACGLGIVVLLVWRMHIIAGMPEGLSTALIRIERPLTLSNLGRSSWAGAVAIVLAIVAVPLFPALIVLRCLGIRPRMPAWMLGWHHRRRGRFLRRWISELRRLHVRRVRRVRRVRHVRHVRRGEKIRYEPVATGAPTSSLDDVPVSADFWLP